MRASLGAAHARRVGGRRSAGSTTDGECVGFWNFSAVLYEEVLHGSFICKLYLWKLFLAQNARCFYSGIPSGKRRDFWNFFSLERIDNKRGHVEGNVVFICRVFNVRGARRSSIWHWIQHQTHVPLSDAQLARCKAEEAEDMTKLLRSTPVKAMQ